MRAKLRASGLVFGLALLLFGCEDSGLIGLDVDSQNVQFKVQYQELNLPASVVLNDSIVTKNRLRLLVGNVQDPTFGEVQASAFTQFSLSQINPGIPENSEYDSLVLILGYDYTYGANFESGMSFNVHRLTEDLFDSAFYYTFSSTEFDPVPIGSKSYSYVVNGDAIELDTTIRVSIDDRLGEDLFNRALNGDTIYTSTDLFREYFKGVALVTEDQNTAVSGFDLQNSRMDLYYHFLNSNGEVITRTYGYTFVTVTHYNNITSDRSGTILAPLTETYTEFDPGDGNVYLQSGSGISIKIDMAPFVSFSDTINSMLINRADFIISPVESFEFNAGPPTSTIYYFTDETSRRFVSNTTGQARTLQEDIPGIDQNQTTQPLVVEFESEANGYNSTMASYLQGVYQGDVLSTQLLMFAEFPEETQSINKMTIKGDSIRLGVYYTITDPSTQSN